MKATKVVYVVGDKFESFSKHTDVYTFSTFIKLISNNKEKFNCDLLVLGQGLNTEEKDILKVLVVHAGIGCIQESVEPLARSTICHKHKSENIMISDPIQIEPNYLYKAHLHLNDDCAEMSDHITGQHIQGMVFTEAARQMMLAVSEKFILKRNEKENSYCALIKINSQFFQFGFPIETQIIHKITKLENDKPGRYKIKTITEFIQNNKIISVVEIDYLFNNKNILSQREINMADTVLSENRQIYLESFKLPLVG